MKQERKRVCGGIRRPSSGDRTVLARCAVREIYAGIDEIKSARLLVEHYPVDDRAVSLAARELHLTHPEEAIEAITRILPENGLHPRSRFHILLGGAYERLDMMYEAADQFQKAYASDS